MGQRRRIAVVVTAAVLAATVTPGGRSADATTQKYVPPVAGGRAASTHHDYPAADIFAPGGCGVAVVAPTAGRVQQVRRTDLWRTSTDNPAHRGGKYVTILGVDGVRYYLAHFASIDDTIVVGKRVRAGTHLGTVGKTGRAGSCHLHLGLSPNCPRKEWKVRRGVVRPQTYLSAWRTGTAKDPGPEVRRWAKANKRACAAAAAAPHAADA